jgi:hypothetical protein
VNLFLSPTNPIEWYQEKYCSKCKNKPCIKKGTGIYTTNIDYSGKTFCALAALLLLNLNRPLLKELGKQ